MEGSGEGRGQQTADGGELVDPAGHGDGVDGAAEIVQAVVVLHVVRLGRHVSRVGGEMVKGRRGEGAGREEGTWQTWSTASAGGPAPKVSAGPGPQ